MNCRTPEKSRGTDTDDTDDTRVLAGEAIIGSGCWRGLLGWWCS